MIHYLQLRSIYIYTSLGELTTIHVTYIKKGKTVHYIYIIFNNLNYKFFCPFIANFSSEKFLDKVASIYQPGIDSYTYQRTNVLTKVDVYFRNFVEALF